MFLPNALCSGIVLRVLFHPKQLLLFSSCDSGEVRVWDLVTKSCMHSLKGGHISAVPALCLSPDGWHVLSGGRDKVACVWDIRNGARVSTVPVFEGVEGESSGSREWLHVYVQCVCSSQWTGIQCSRHLAKLSGRAEAVGH